MVSVLACDPNRTAVVVAAGCQCGHYVSFTDARSIEMGFDLWRGYGWECKELSGSFNGVGECSTMLLKALPTFNITTLPSDSPIPFTLRYYNNKPFAHTIVNAIPDSRNTNADVRAAEAEASVDRKLALASWLSNAEDPNGRAVEQEAPPRHAFRSAGTRSAPSRSSIPGKFSKYSAGLSPPRSHGETPKPLERPPRKREPRFWTPKPIERRFENPLKEGEDTGEKGIIVGSHGISYRLPGAPFEYQYSYTETPRVKPLALREAPFVPFGPTTLPRPWTGRAPLPPSKKKLPEFDSFKLPPPNKKGVKHVQAPGPFLPGQSPRYVQTREERMGDPLTPAEVEALVQSCCHSNRQLNIGRDGLTHNMLENIHAHWKRRRVCKIKCKGVSTVDMDNVCYHLEEKTGGKIIHRAGGVVYLFRGRNYNYRTRPRFPLMLWKPAAAVYPRLIERAPGGLTVEEANELRRKGRTLLPICKLGKNGVYLNLAKDVRDAFEESELVRINCQGLNPSDYKKIGAKLKDLVPCVLLSFESEHVLMWRGKNWKSRFSEKGSAIGDTSSPSECSTDDAANSNRMVTSPLDENFSSESLVSDLSSNTEYVAESDRTLSKNGVDQASYDTAVAGPYSEKLGGTHFSLSEVAARINSEVDCLEDKLNPSSSSEVELVEINESSTIEKFSDEGNIQTCVELQECVEHDSGASKSATKPNIECLSQDSFDLPLLELDEFSKPDEVLFPSGRQEMVEDGDFLSDTVNDEVSVDHTALNVDSLEKPIVSPFFTSETPVIISDSLTEATDEGFELDSSEVEPAKHTDKCDNGAYVNELTVHSTAVSGQLNKGGLDIESLWQQGIESGRILLLDETFLDPDIVHEKAIAFAKDAPEGPYPKRKFNSCKKLGKPTKKIPQNRMANPNGGRKKITNSGNDRREISSYDDVSHGGLPLDELAKLLAP